MHIWLYKNTKYNSDTIKSEDALFCHLTESQALYKKWEYIKSNPSNKNKEKKKKCWVLIELKSKNNNVTKNSINFNYVGALM